MKKVLLLASAMTVGFASVDAQVIFQEDFSGGSMPAGWTTTDVDGLTPHANVSWATDAWVVRADFNDANDWVIASNSWYDPAGQADDWIATPAITLGASGNVLTWEAYAQDPSYPDGYEVWVNTTGQTPSDMMGGTMLFSVNAEADVATMHTESLDAFAGQTVYIGWRNNSNDMFVLVVDDVEVRTLPAVDAEVTDITTDNFQVAPANVDISFDVANSGQNAITSFDAQWTDGTNTFSQTFNTNLASFASANFTFNDQLAIAAGGSSNVTVTVSNVNGAGPDGNANNDAVTETISGLAFMPNKVVVGEEATGTWCGWCPRGWDFMEYMAAQYPSDWIGIAVHNSDPMANATYDAGMGALIGGYPSGLVDRAEIDIDPTQFEAAYNNRKNMVPAADVSVTTVMTSATTVDITVSATFAATVSNSNYRLNCVIVESGIQNASYDQTNYYSGGNDPLAGYGYDWGALGDPAPGSGLVYNHVGVDILGGWAGQTGSVAANVNANGVESHTFSYTIPAGSDINNMEAVGMLIDQNTGEIVNAGHGALFVGIAEETANFNLNVYPNPFSDITNIAVDLNDASEVTVEVINMVGQTVSAKNYGTLNGQNVITFDGSNLEAGIYFVNVIVDGEKLTRKVTLTK